MTNELCKGVRKALMYHGDGTNKYMSIMCSITRIGRGSKEQRVSGLLSRYLSYCKFSSIKEAVNNAQGKSNVKQ